MQHKMASLLILNSVFSSSSISIFLQANMHRKSDLKRKVINLRSSYRTQRSIIHCASQERDDKSNVEEPPESLFMKELKRRGMTPNSLVEDSKRLKSGLDEEMEMGKDTGSFSKRNAISTEFEEILSDQRERSMALNSEGLEGLIPRAKLLLTIGATFFLSFWPLILSTIACFSALYLYFGSSFIHDGSDTSISPTQYMDPYTLLEDERISPTSPRVN